MFPTLGSVKKSAPAETRKSRKARTTPYQGTYDAFLKRLVVAREEAKMTQREVSDKMGMAHSFLSKCETGERRVDVIEFLQLARLYSKSLDYFLSGE